MAHSPFSFYLDIDAVRDWLLDLSSQVIPDWPALLNQPLSSTFDVFSTNLMMAISSTCNALQSWLTLLFHLCRLCIHLLVVAFPYIKPMVTTSYTILESCLSALYRYWNSLDLSIQLSLLGLLSVAALMYWINKNRYIGRAHHYAQHQMDRVKAWCSAKWQRLIQWISVRSQMTARMFPHLVWWSSLCLVLWFVSGSVYDAHSLWSFTGCFVFPAIKSYSIIRKYAMLTPSGSQIDETQKKQLRECIDPLRFWLQFWSSRAFILWTYHIAVYALSFIPGIVAQQVTAYIASHDAVFAVITDWTVLWLLTIDSSLSWIAGHLTATIFRVHDEFDDDGSGRHPIRSSGLADRISLSSANAVLSKMLSVIRLLVPNVVYLIIHDGLYQFLIFFGFLLLSPRLGCLMLGYLLPIYTSILALHHLHELRSKIELWNNDQRDDLITPQPSLLISNQRERERENERKSDSDRQRATSNVLSEVRTQPDDPPNEGVDEQNGRSPSWSDLSFWLKPLDMFSFHGAADLDKNERKRAKMHQEADHVLSTIVDRLKYWIVFAATEWIYYFLGHHLGLMHYVPFWNSIKFALILWLQLPYVPYSAPMLYEYLILPVVVLDIGQSVEEQTNPQREESTVRAVTAVSAVGTNGKDSTERNEKGPSRVKGVESMMLLGTKTTEKKRKEVPKVQRRKSVSMKSERRSRRKSEDEESEPDKKHDPGDDEQDFRRNLRLFT